MKAVRFTTCRQRYNFFGEIKAVKKLKIGLVGATGLVGETFINVLEERQTPLEELRPFASENSLGKSIHIDDRKFPIQVLQPGCFAGLDVVFFSSGEEISKTWAPQAVADGAYAIDNSSAFRNSENHLLCVPEVNGHLIPKSPALIANPNCSTIQLVLALLPLQKSFGLKDVRVATYQSVSGAGREALNELIDQTVAMTSGEEMNEPKHLPARIAFNVIPQIGSLSSDGYCSEETKIMLETKKILNEPHLSVSAFTARVPAINVHSEAVWVTLAKEANLQNVLHSLRQGEGLVLIDEDQGSYPTKVHGIGRDEVFVGRVHQDINYPNTYQMWVVSDNLRKGAATNGLQIAERIFDIK